MICAMSGNPPWFCWRSCFVNFWSRLTAFLIFRSSRFASTRWFLGTLCRLSDWGGISERYFSTLIFTLVWNWFWSIIYFSDLISLKLMLVGYFRFRNVGRLLLHNVTVNVNYDLTFLINYSCVVGGHGNDFVVYVVIVNVQFCENR